MQLPEYLFQDRNCLKRNLMKKPALFIMVLFMSKNIFAADFSLSAGGGGLLGYTFTRYTLKGGSLESIQKMDRFDYGGFVFFDFTYGEFSIMIQGGSNSYEERMLFDATPASDNMGVGIERSLGFALMGKYPFRINEQFTWFPMLGIEYHIVQMIMRRNQDGFAYHRTDGYFVEDMDKNGNPYPLSAWNSWWINIGAGLDYSITSALFVRCELLFGFRLPTRYEMGALELIEELLEIRNPKLSGLTGSPTLRIGIGYRFFSWQSRQPFQEELPVVIPDVHDDDDDPSQKEPVFRIPDL